MPEFRYKAFISYSWVDAAWGKWLHHAIETYRTPQNRVENSDIEELYVKHGGLAQAAV